MKKKTLFVTAVLFCVTVAFAGSNVFTGTAATQAKACVSASNQAIKFVNSNSLTFATHNSSPSTSECKCQGDNQTGWECQVSVSY